MCLIHGMWYADESEPTSAGNEPWQEVAISGYMKTMFHGMFCHDLEQRPNKSQGWMRDHLGPSFLLDIKVETYRVSFDKAYIGETGVWRYVFTRKHESGLWVGKYEFVPAEETGPDEQKKSGVAWMSIKTVMEKAFFDPAGFINLLGKIHV